MEFTFYTSDTVVVQIDRQNLRIFCKANVDKVYVHNVNDLVSIGQRAIATVYNHQGLPKDHVLRLKFENCFLEQQAIHKTTFQRQLTWVKCRRLREPFYHEGPILALPITYSHLPPTHHSWYLMSHTLHAKGMTQMSRGFKVSGSVNCRYDTIHQHE